MTQQLTEDLVKCGCGRSASGYCTGLHNLSEAEWQEKLLEEFKDEYNGS
jgi:hypothetical protein